MLTLPTLSNDVTGALSLTLGPSPKSLLFGSGLFGASGGGLLPSNNSAIANPTLLIRPAANYAFFELPVGQLPVRMFVIGGPIPAIPEPTSLALMGFGSLGLLGGWYRKRRHAV